MYADDTQTFASSYDANELIVKLNCDQPLKSKSASLPINFKCISLNQNSCFGGSFYDLNNKISEQLVVVYNLPVSRTSAISAKGFT